MDNHKMTPFVKWAGGKKQLLQQLESRFPEQYHRYYEPFIGGGALLFDVAPRNAVINDLNAQLLNIYRQLKKNAESVIAIVQSYDNHPCDQSFYLTMRDAYNAKILAKAFDAECAALTIWINKHCFNGLYRVNSKGLFNVPFNNKTTGASMQEENLRNIGNYLKTTAVEIREGDFEAACADVKAGDFVYFDSPYLPLSKTARFDSYTQNGFSSDDHKRLAKLYRNLDRAGVMVMLSNHDVDVVYELYKGYRIDAIPVRRAINRDVSKRVGQEVIITNY